MTGPVSIPAPDSVALVQGAGSVSAPTEKTLKAARQFEGLVMSLVFQSMRKTIQPSGLFGGSDTSRSTYDYLLDQAVADKAAATGRGWGLADRIAAAWSKNQGAKTLQKS